MDINKTLKERGKEYGDWKDDAEICETIEEAMRKCGLDNLPPMHRCTLKRIAIKIARILNGNPNNKDSWVDIAGYATLVAERIEE